MIQINNQQAITSALMENISRDYSKLSYDEKYLFVDGLALQKYREYVATGKYPYLDYVVDYAIPALPVLSESQKQNLKAQIYQASQYQSQQERIAKRDAMKAEGWLLMDEAVFDDAIKYNKKLELSGAMAADWITKKIKGVFKPFVAFDGRKFLIPPRCHKTGLPLNTLLCGGETDCFCKIV